MDINSITTNVDASISDNSINLSDSQDSTACAISNFSKTSKSSLVCELAMETDANSKDTVSEVDDQDMRQKYSLFVHVEMKDYEECDGDKKKNETGNEFMKVSCLAEDPIGVIQEIEKDSLTEFSKEDTMSFNGETITSDKTTMLKLIADTEIRIIADISEEEKDAATSAAVETAELCRSKDDASTLVETSLTCSMQTNAEDSTNSTQQSTNSSEDPLFLKEFMPSVNNTDAVDQLQIKIFEIPEEKTSEKWCHQCCYVKKCLYKLEYQDNALFICSKLCLITFQTLNKHILGGCKLHFGKKIPGSQTDKVFIRKCAECSENIKQYSERILSWQTMDFCNENCLLKYQYRIGSQCGNCKKDVNIINLGKYCVRFGRNIRQFCCIVCLNEFKKRIKDCNFCQKDISKESEGNLARIVDKGQFKDFCSQFCVEKYDQMINNSSSSPTDLAQCTVCNYKTQIQIIFNKKDKAETKQYKFCCYHCLLAFSFMKKNHPVQCDMCTIFFENENCAQFSIFYENLVKNFCSETCQIIYIIKNRRIISCGWCKVKKYNYDCIRKSCITGRILMMCSLNCLSLFRVSFKEMKCDFCSNIYQAQYHLTMSDASIRNFCSYHCVKLFKKICKKFSVSLGFGETSTSASGSKMYTNEEFVNIEALENNGTETLLQINLESTSAVEPRINHHVVVKPPALPLMKNASTYCGPISHNKSVFCKPHLCTKETQIYEEKENIILVPVPVPIYVPAPLPTFSVPVPHAIPFPLPIPVPVFIPLIRNSAHGIMKEIKKKQIQVPNDPFEAELLVMADISGKKVDNTDSESEKDDNGDDGSGGDFSPKVIDTSNADDILQIKFKVPTESNKATVDLDEVLTANMINARQDQVNTAVVATEQAGEDPTRKCKRQRYKILNKPAKRTRRMSSHVETTLPSPPQPLQPSEPMEEPDANNCLKYTFGVKIWKRWVTTKNAELKKSRNVKLFRDEILHLTTNELNDSLCLFVKEVRNLGGVEYAPDSIYYLCLGIQKYLIENGRNDNIFIDVYYKKFTDCLDEVARKFTELFNDSHYIATRIEEEHLWESKQLGAHSPYALLNTLMFFNTKYYKLSTVDEHLQLSFSAILRVYSSKSLKVSGILTKKLRLYPRNTNLCKSKIYEQPENNENPMRCSVKLYEFYLSKCPESVKLRKDIFYLLPEKSSVSDSPVWYSKMFLGREELEKMLNRVKMVKEINVALLLKIPNINIADPVIYKSSANEVIVTRKLQFRPVKDIFSNPVFNTSLNRTIY